MKKIILTGGGTAGHIMPNIALLPFLYGNEIHYIGGDGMEKEILKNYPITFHRIPCVKYRRGLHLSNLLIPFKLFNSVRAAKKILDKINPDVIFSKGGFVSLPVALANKTATLISHESDMSLGLTNRLIRHKCKYLCTSFDLNYGKNAIYTGAIIRRELYKGKRTSSTLLIMGGSLGAKAINDCVASCLSELTKRYNIVHIVGKGNLTKNAPRYTQLEFADNMADIYANADLIVSRGGANSLFEICALGKRALIIPLPKGASRGDQEDNADYFQKKGAVRVLPQQNLNPKNLISELEKLQSFTPARLSVDGTFKVAKLILQ